MQASLDFTVRLSFRTTAKKQFAAELIVNGKIDSEKEEEKWPVNSFIFENILCFQPEGSKLGFSVAQNSASRVVGV